jgi:hypothetical protein
MSWLTHAEPWNFEAQYVGTLAVDENKGNETIESAIAHFEVSDVEF